MKHRVHAGIRHFFEVLFHSAIAKELDYYKTQFAFAIATGKRLPAFFYSANNENGHPNNCI